MYLTKFICINFYFSLEQSKQLIAKLCNDLAEQANLEERRFEDTKRLHGNSIKNQLAKWEEYEV